MTDLLASLERHRRLIVTPRSGWRGAFSNPDERAGELVDQLERHWHARPTPARVHVA